MEAMIQPFSLLTEYDIQLFQAGKHFRLYEKLGSHTVEHEGRSGVYFAVYAPAAASVRLIGSFNEWSGHGYELLPRWDGSGIWEGFCSHANHGDIYKYEIHSTVDNRVLHKADPFANYCEIPSETGSIIWDIDYEWEDDDWMSSRESKNDITAPYSIYEVHSASWKIHPDGELYSYEELSTHLVEYVKEMGFTHIEFMPITEHPYGGSWGYQVTGFFAPSSRQGTPQQFMTLVDKLHEAGIGVILDWVPSHFPSDAHGLGYFDGSCVYEHPNPQKGYHPDWKSLIFNYGRNEVRSFLISSALFWLDKYHIDGLRVDAVASMLYLDYSREEGQWEPNIHGGNHNLDAISFIRDFNHAVYEHYPDVQTIAEESTAFPMVSHPVYLGGLGFGMKWMMGWMHDTIQYFKTDPYFRKHQHGKLAFNMYYFYSENYVLPFSHDEVVHGKAPMIYKMPGDDQSKYHQLRLLYSYMFTHPGHKLLFMGSEFGQTREWSYERELDWFLLQHEAHAGVLKLIQDLNQLYQTEKALFELNFEYDGFEWIDYSDNEKSIVTFLRKGKKKKDVLLVICNFIPVVQENYGVGVPESKSWKVIFNSDDKKYGGSTEMIGEKHKTEEKDWNNRDYKITLDVPELSCIVLKQNK